MITIENPYFLIIAFPILIIFIYIYLSGFENIGLIKLIKKFKRKDPK